MSDGSVVTSKRRTRRARRAWRAIPLAILLLLSLFAFLSVTIRVVRAVREVRTAQQIRNGSEDGIRPWMTISYIARAYGVPESDLFSLLNLTPTEQNRRAPLGALAKRNGRDLTTDIATINAYLAERQATPRAPAPPPGPQPPTPPGGAP